MSSPRLNLTLTLCSSANVSKLFKCSQHTNNVSKKLHSFYEAEEFSDITLIAGIDNSRFQAHRLVLSASSDFFLAMFRSSLREAKAENVDLKEIDGVTLKLLLDFMYTASIEIRNETVENLLRAADFLQMNTLRTACSNFIIENLDAGNCLGFALFAEQGGYVKLYKESIAYACEHYGKVSKESEFLQLNEIQLGKLISSDNVYSHFEESILLSLVTWLEHDKKNRMRHIPSLLSHIRYQFLKPKFIKEYKKLLNEALECGKLIRSWLQWHSSAKIRSKLPENTPRKVMEVLGIITGDDTNEFEVQTYDQELNVWSYVDWPRPPKRRESYSAIVVNKKLIIAGGFVRGRDTKRVESLDLQTLEWTDLPPMGRARRNPGLAELNGHLYVVGGYTNRDYIPFVERYDFSTRQWQEVPPFCSSYEDIQVAVLDDKLYVCGDLHSAFECYDPVSDKWTEKSVKNVISDYFRIVALDGYLYAVGANLNGWTTGIVERYDPVTDTWIKVSPLGTERSEIECIAINHRLIACKGFDGDDWMDVVEEYNPEIDKWKMTASPAPHEHVCFKLIKI